MQIAWSARRTCIASASAVECTATVWMPISWQARWMRSAISPRLAISSFLIGVIGTAYSTTTSGWSNSTGWPFSTSTDFTVPALGARIGFITFIASTISSVSPAATF